MSGIRFHSRLVPAARLLLALCLLAPAVARAADKTKLKPTTQAAAAPVAAPVAAPETKGAPAKRAGAEMSIPGLEALGLPHYEPPASYSVDLVMTTDGHDMSMKRFIDNGRVRTEIASEGQNIVMIETGDEKGTSYTLMPDEKRAMKQSRVAMHETMARMEEEKKKLPKKLQKDMAQKTTTAATAETSEPTSPTNFKVEDLGDEKLNGIAAKKVRIVTDQGPALGWFDKATGAPLRFETTADGKKSVMEWKNMKPGPQPAQLYEIPKGYEVMDLDEMMEKMKGMGSMGGMPGMGGMGGMMAGGMASSMGQSMGANLGSSLGSSLGASFGGPIGAIAGQYIGGKIGGMIGKKAVDMALPGKQ